MFCFRKISSIFVSYWYDSQPHGDNHKHVWYMIFISPRNHIVNVQENDSHTEKKKYLRFLERERLLWPSSHEMFSFLPLELLLEYSLFRSLVSSYSGFHNQSRYSIYFWSILFNSLHFDPLCVWIYCPR